MEISFWKLFLFFQSQLILISYFRPFVEGDTASYLRNYFKAENIPVFEDTFCNAEDIKSKYSEIFNDDLDVLIKNTELHRGRLISLWPWGYKVLQVSLWVIQKNTLTIFRHFTL